MANEKRLIDANALKAEIFDFKVNLHPQNQDYGTGYFSALSVVEGMLAYAPTVDAVEVVRCKDCIYYDCGNGHRPWCNHLNGLDEIHDDDFCSYGVKKGDWNA